jgi:hypothetical protein
MKTTWPLLAVFVSVLVFAGTQACAGFVPTYLVIHSPDHPETWASGAMLQSKNLRWDNDRKVLFAYIVYSTAEFQDRQHPAQSDLHSVYFPGVYLASNGVDLMANDKNGGSVVIGEVHNGFFGQSVSLNKHVDFEVHREGPHIYAKLTFNRLMDFR